MNLKDKVIVVTGAGSGIGQELTLELVKKGNKVAAVGHTESHLLETVELAGDLRENISVHVLDVSDQSGVEKLLQEVLSKHGTVDGIINNAGIIQPFVKVQELSYEKINQVMNVNFFGTLFMVKTFLPTLLTRPEAHIVNVSSMGGFFPFPGQTVYGASKAADKLLTEGLYTELLNTNVRVTSVMPGSIDTNIMKNSGVEMTSAMKSMQGSMKALSAKKAAQIIIRAIEKNKAKVLVGNDAKMMDFLYRLMPVRATTFFAKLMGPKILG